jgi:hypothetical protein
MSESWNVIGIETDVPFGKTIREWVEMSGFASYKEADQYRLDIMLNSEPKTYFFVRRVEL